MTSLPKHILKSLMNNKTSLGEHPSYPPEEEEKFIVRLLGATFEELAEKVDEADIEDVKEKLSNLLEKCKKIEQNNKEALEGLCTNVINELFCIPEDTLNIEAKLVEKVESKEERIIPEKTSDNFTFEDIDDMNYLTDEIYKRRMLNALVAGASMFYMSNISTYVQALFEINEDLPSLYKKILNYNNILLYLDKDTFDIDNTTNAGRVDVNISSSDTYPSIKAEAVLYPVLLEEIIKGLLELAISHGLPKSIDKAKYVIGKSDFKLAEIWDLRLGYPLWKLINNEVSACGYDILEVGLNFFLMYLSEMDCKQFNKSLQEIFARTKRGREIISDICEEILYNKEKDDFDNYIQTRNAEIIQINDDDCFTPEELLMTDDKNY